MQLLHTVHCFIFTINVGIGTYFLCFHWYLKKDATRVKFGTCFFGTKQQFNY